MRKFSSYGPVDKDSHYYVPRQELIDHIHMQLLGENPEKKGGHYITIWGPRQTGKTWALFQAFHRLRKDKRFDVVCIGVETMKMEEDIVKILNYIGKHIVRLLNKQAENQRPNIDSPEDFEALFSKNFLDKPLILIIDEFDALNEKAIAAIVGCFRNIYNARLRDSEHPAGEKDYLLHSVALIGVRSVLGVENVKGSPFNVQRSIHIPNLTFFELESMFKWHERESGQSIDQEVIERLYYETKGQPGLTCWFGELLTEGWDEFRVSCDMPVDMKLFQKAYAAASQILPNNNIMNIISKAKQEPYKYMVLDMFRTDRKTEFKHDEPLHNFLYMNGVIDREKTNDEGEKYDEKYYVKFPCPFVQKRLFNYFASQITGYVGKLYDPFEELDDAINETGLNIRNIVKRYRTYLLKNRDWVLKSAPKRSDLRVHEAVFHFNLYMYLAEFLRSFGGEIYPEFPTGNGKIDLFVKYAGKTYGIEVKSFRNRPSYKEALIQAALYGKQLKLKEISLIFFIEHIDEKNREILETDYSDPDTGVKVMPVFVATGY